MGKHYKHWTTRSLRAHHWCELGKWREGANYSPGKELSEQQQTLYSSLGAQSDESEKDWSIRESFGQIFLERISSAQLTNDEGIICNKQDNDIVCTSRVLGLKLARRGGSCWSLVRRVSWEWSLHLRTNFGTSARNRLLVTFFQPLSFVFNDAVLTITRPKFLHQNSQRQEVKN